MTRDRQEGVEIKVVTPPPHNAAGQSPSSAARRRRNHSAFSEFRPFKLWAPWLVPAFAVANIVLFAIAMYINDCPKNSPNCFARKLGRFAFQPMKENPLLGPSASTLDKMGALDVSMVVQKKQVWRLFTCIWLHAGLFHLFANMLSLLFIGIRLEQEFGFVRIGMLYIISGFGGSLLSSLFNRTGISVGASGALFGLLGAMLSELLTNWTIYANKFAALLTLIFIIAINLAVGILPHVDNFAHLGGFTSGFLLGFVFLIRPQYGYFDQKTAPRRHAALSAKSKHKTYQYVLWVISLVLLIAGYTAGLVVLLRGTDLNNHCSWCHFLICIPTSLWSCISSDVYCESRRIRNRMNLTCITNGRTGMYTVSGDNQFQFQQLCSQLCS
ncbi:PREDICTED: RHOMBOID-like protein 1 [Tarenaya hassleriana]|uniref:RHOMBOID-like protein 1 n=1 Tax=Tarenaya hassleriana TaxID=28532 RepID=UPI00053C0D5B|nr:PREDICTED: RHOMBOID-like protein 1 [Tarenaya hassleriana]